MGLLKEMFAFIRKKNLNDSDGRSGHIFYKIIDVLDNDEIHVVQCINTKATFNFKTDELVYDVDVLYGLHPVQACYIGIEYAKYLRNSEHLMTVPYKQLEKLNKYPTCRYGSYRVYCQDRDGNIGFIVQATNQVHLMDPRDIALTEELIQKFDASHAFYIGLHAGLKLKAPITHKKGEQNDSPNTSKPHLKLIKGGNNV